MTTSNEAENGNGSPKPVIITDENLQLPKDQRLYIDSSEMGDYAQMGLAIYEGPRHGEYVDRSLLDDKGKPTKVQIEYGKHQYVDARQHWIQQHIQQYPIKSTGPLKFRDKETGSMETMELNLHPVPNHSPNLHRYTRDGEEVFLPSGIAHKDSQGNKLSPDRDEYDRPIIAQQNQALLLNAQHGQKIPRDATNVFVAGTAEAPIQAIYRNVQGKQQLIFSPEEAKRRKDIHWANQTKARKSADSLIETLSADIDNIEKWPENDQVLLLIGRMGFRHGGDSIRRLPANDEEEANDDMPNTGTRTGIGASSLNTNEVSIQDDGSVRFQFLGKSNIPHDHKSTDPLVKQVVQQALRGKQSGDQLFPRANEKANIRRLRELTGNDRMEIKDIRTYIGTSIARDLIKQELATRGGRTTTEKEFEEVAKRISLEVGKALGHKSGKRDAKTGEMIYEDKGSMARKYYIDPVIWQDIAPEGTIAKLLKMVASLQTLSKALPPNAVYSSTEAPPEGTMTFVTEDREAEYWLQPTEVFPQTPNVGDAINANPQARQILQDLGQEGTPYVVGGGVRDILMGMPSKDIDIEVHGVPMAKLKSLMEKHGGQPEQVGKQFGVFKVGDVDVALPRTETKTGTKHTDFDVQTHTELPLKQAAQRRDFTMNALMYDVKNHKVLDFFGGHDDIVAKKIKHVDDKTFVEDPLRVYRAAQFAGRFGFSIDDSTKKLAQSMDLSDLPRERVFEEMSKLLLKSPKPSVGLQALDDMGVLDKHMPELKQLQDTHQRGDYHAEGDVFTHTKMVVDEATRSSKRFTREKDKQIIMLAALCHDLGKPTTTDERGRALGHSEAGLEPTRQLLSRITTDKEITDTVLSLVEHHLLPLNYYNNKTDVKDSTFRRLINKHGTRFLHLLSAVSEADNAGRLHRHEDGTVRQPTHEANEWFRASISRIGTTVGTTSEGRLKPLVTGQDLLDLGFVQGKRVGEVLQDIQRQQEDGKLTDKKEALDYLQNIHKSYISEYFLKAKGKYKGRTGGITPDWTMKLPGEERDIDEWAEARRRKAEERQWGIKPVGGQPMSKTWVGSLNEKGFSSPLIKQVIGSQMWFAQDGIDYIARLGTNEDDLVTAVEKATFTYNRPSVSYAPSGRNNHNSKRRSSGMQGERYQGDVIDDEEDD
tara:strand:+ start:85 stop:3561 length:3477 start_codon:yes stop_codon:yes gene_type:complete